MLLELSRFEQDAYGCIGELVGKGLRCYVLERQATGAFSRIPALSYRLGIKALGTSHLDGQMREFLGKAHKGMLQVQDVPGRTEILIHPGNTTEDLEGCLAPGQSFDRGKGQDKTYWLNSSRVAYQAIYVPISQALLAGEAVTLQISENFLLGKVQGVPIA